MREPILVLFIHTAYNKHRKYSTYREKKQIILKRQTPYAIRHSPYTKCDEVIAKHAYLIMINDRKRNYEWQFRQFSEKNGANGDYLGLQSVDRHRYSLMSGHHR